MRHLTEYQNQVIAKVITETGATAYDNCSFFDARDIMKWFSLSKNAAGGIISGMIDAGLAFYDEGCYVLSDDVLPEHKTINN